MCSRSLLRACRNPQTLLSQTLPLRKRIVAHSQRAVDVLRDADATNMTHEPRHYFPRLPQVFSCRIYALKLLQIVVLISIAAVAQSDERQQASAGAGGNCKWSNVTDQIVRLQHSIEAGKSTQRQRWIFGPEGEEPCNLQNLVGERLLASLTSRRITSRSQEDMREIRREVSKRSRSILFIGDSSVRNTALSVVLSMCNPDGDFEHCDPAIAVPFLSSSGSRQPSSAEKKPNPFRCPARGTNSSSNTCEEVSYSFTALKNLTSAAYYQSREERAARWKAKEVVPLLTLSYRQVIDIHILEAGCSSRTDGLWRMLDFVTESSAADPLQRVDGIGGSLQASDGRFIHFDALVLSGGLHCSYKVYRGGNWYRSLFSRIPRLVNGDAQPTHIDGRLLGKKAMKGGGWHVPVVWLEVTHCLKGDGGHFYKQGSKFMLNYRKVAACPYIDQHVLLMNALVEAAGALVAPTRHITRNLSLLPSSGVGVAEPSSCVFVDLMHPTVECYLPIAQSVIHTILWALRAVANATAPPSDDGGGTGNASGNDSPNASADDSPHHRSQGRDREEDGSAILKLDSSEVSTTDVVRGRLVSGDDDGTADEMVLSWMSRQLVVVKVASLLVVVLGCASWRRRRAVLSARASS